MDGLPSATRQPGLMPADDRSDRQQLDRALQAAVRAGDAGTLARGYVAAANLALADGQEPAAAFFLTHAYVWALVAGDEAAAPIAARLHDMGRLDQQDRSRGQND